MQISLGAERHVKGRQVYDLYVNRMERECYHSSSFNRAWFPDVTIWMPNHRIEVGVIIAALTVDIRSSIVRLSQGDLWSHVPVLHT